MQIKERRRHFSYFPKRDEFGAEWTGVRGIENGVECVCAHASECVRVNRLFWSNTLVCNWLPVVAVNPAVGMSVVVEDRRRSHWR